MLFQLCSGGLLRLEDSLLCPVRFCPCFAKAVTSPDGPGDLGKTHKTCPLLYLPPAPARLLNSLLLHVFCGTGSAYWPNKKATGKIAKSLNVGLSFEVPSTWLLPWPPLLVPAGRLLTAPPLGWRLKSLHSRLQQHLCAHKEPAACFRSWLVYKVYWSCALLPLCFTTLAPSVPLSFG